MMYLVITEKLTQEGKKNFKKVLEWQKRFDEWLISHGATWKSVKHFVTLIGEPLYETWLEYPNYSALDEDDEKTKEYVKNPEWQELISKMNVYFQRINSRTMKEI
ncbi:MAG: hypothetical protein OEZ18_03850 [Candidatus Bathyarchaeota archaeon]|nr:hypothetical protein [Candidatus Bathyarchaeota archaeon]